MNRFIVLSALLFPLSAQAFEKIQCAGFSGGGMAHYFEVDDIERMKSRRELDLQSSDATIQMSCPKIDDWILIPSIEEADVWKDYSQWQIQATLIRNLGRAIIFLQRLFYEPETNIGEGPKYHDMGGMIGRLRELKKTKGLSVSLLRELKREWAFNITPEEEKFLDGFYELLSVETFVPEWMGPMRKTNWVDKILSPEFDGRNMQIIVNEMSSLRDHVRYQDYPRLYRADFGSMIEAAEKIQKFIGTWQTIYPAASAAVIAATRDQFTPVTNGSEFLEMAKRALQDPAQPFKEELSKSLDILDLYRQVDAIYYFTYIDLWTLDRLLDSMLYGRPWTEEDQLSLVEEIKKLKAQLEFDRDRAKVRLYEP